MTWTARIPKLGIFFLPTLFAMYVLYLVGILLCTYLRFLPAPLYVRPLASFPFLPSLPLPRQRGTQIDAFCFPSRTSRTRANQPSGGVALRGLSRKTEFRGAVGYRASHRTSDPGNHGGCESERERVGYIRARATVNAPVLARLSPAVLRTPIPKTPRGRGDEPVSHAGPARFRVNEMVSRRPTYGLFVSLFLSS